MNIGKAIRIALVNLDLNQKKLANRLGVTPMYISKVVRGETMPSLNRMLSIASALEMKLSELIALSEKYEVDE